MSKAVSKIGTLMGLVLFAVVLLSGTAFTQSESIPQRSDIDEKYKWNLEDIYPTIDAWNADFDYLQANMGRLNDYKGKLGESAGTLFNCLTLQDSLNMILGKLFVYAFMKQDEDTRVSEYQQLGGRIAGLNSQFGEIESYIAPELLTIPDDKLLGFVDSNKNLEPYRFYFEDLIRSKTHILSDKEERILALAGRDKESIRNIFTVLYNADVQLPTIIDENNNEIQLTRQRYAEILESPNRDVRRNASKAYNDAHEKYFNTFGAILAATVSHHWLMAQARHYNSCLEATLDSENIPPQVLTNLIDAVDANLAPLHKWMGIRKRILGLDELHGYDTSVPLVPEAKEKVQYDNAIQTVQTGLKPLGDKYMKDLKQGLSGGWIDVYETEGKRSGGYQWGSYLTHPYILLNYTDRMENMFTLAHELGHAMHSYYSKKTQPYRISGYTLFVAEVASTTNEALLMNDLLNSTKDKQKKMYLINYYIEEIINTFYFQTLLSEFELMIYDTVEKGGALSAESMKDMYINLNQKYWGPEYVTDEWGGWGGLRVPHYTTHYQYYVYKYATGYAAAQAISQKILKGDKKARDQYLEFLSWGGNDYPVEQLQKIGVDMTSPEPINAVINLFAYLVDEMERLLDED